MQLLCDFVFPSFLLSLYAGQLFLFCPSETQNLRGGLHVMLSCLSNDVLYLSEALHVALGILTLSDLILQSAETGRKTSKKRVNLLPHRCENDCCFKCFPCKHINLDGSERASF